MMNGTWIELVERTAHQSKGFAELRLNHHDTLFRYLEHLASVCVPIQNVGGVLLSLLARLRSEGKTLGLIPAGKIARETLAASTPRELTNLHLYDNRAWEVENLLRFPVLSPEKAVFMEDDLIVVASAPFGEELFQQLVELGVPKERIVRISELEEMGHIDYLKCESIEESLRTLPGRKIVFINISFPWANIDRVRLIRERHPDYSMVLLSNQDFMFNGPVLEGIVDGLFDFRILLNLPTLIHTASLLTKDEILMTCGFPFCNIAILMMNCLTVAHHVHEIYDLCDELVHAKGYPRYHHHKMVVKAVGEEIWQADDQAKRHLFSCLDKILYRCDPQEFSNLRNHFSCSTPAFHMLPLQKNSQLPDVEKTSGIHLIHCGHVVIPGNVNDDAWTDCGVQDTLYDIVAELARQRLYFHVFNPADHDAALVSRFLENIGSAEQQYVIYHKPAYDDELVRLLAQYTWGWMVYDFSRYSAVQMPSHHHTLSTKLFTYIQAGLPVVISSEYKFMAGICREYGIGLVIDRSDLPRLKELLVQTDLAAMRQNVLRAREELELGRKFDQYFSFVTEP